MRVLPILFNIEMVRAILDGRKTVTRRLVKVPPYYPHFYKLHDNTDGAITGTKDRLFAGFYKNEQIFYIDGKKHIDAVYYKAPYQPGDILYVRETWCKNYYHDYGKYFYRADGEEIDMPLITGGTIKYGKADGLRWRPYIHMPKEAARIWLKVTDVRVERLQDITEEDAFEEGYEGICPYEHRVRCGDYESMCYVEGDCENPLRLCDKSVPEGFGIEIWNKTIKKPDLDRYGWNANPWVWVVEFERCEKPEEKK